LERARTLEVLLTIFTLGVALFRDLKTAFSLGFVNRMIKLLSSHMIGVPLLHHHHAESYRSFFDHQPPPTPKYRYYRDLGHLSTEEREKVNFDHPDALGSLTSFEFWAPPSIDAKRFLSCVWSLQRENKLIKASWLLF
jgi:hypothetical protein